MYPIQGKWVPWLTGGMEKTATGIHDAVAVSECERNSTTESFVRSTMRSLDKEVKDGVQKLDRRRSDQLGRLCANGEDNRRVKKPGRIPRYWRKDLALPAKVYI